MAYADQEGGAAEGGDEPLAGAGDDVEAKADPKRATNDAASAPKERKGTGRANARPPDG